MTISRLFPLLLISFLHQTTTSLHRSVEPLLLLLISFLHQTTTVLLACFRVQNCFLSHFYIKPQPILMNSFASGDCFLSHFYIKPQPQTRCKCKPHIASYLISTSNHNQLLVVRATASLLLISFLHQTTTLRYSMLCKDLLLLISFLHQTTTRRAPVAHGRHCFLSHFYIKPQRILYNPLIYKELGYVAHIRSG